MKTTRRPRAKLNMGALAGALASKIVPVLCLRLNVDEAQAFEEFKTKMVENEREVRRAYGRGKRAFATFIAKLFSLPSSGAESSGPAAHGNG